jgi:translation initiation factor 4E
MKQLLSFPPTIKLEFKSHDSSLQQRQQIDEARKDKTSQNHHNARNGSKDEKSTS